MDAVRAEHPRALPIDYRALRQAMRGRLGRKHPCWCGSGKRYKNCHFGADEAELRDRPKMSEILDDMVDAAGGLELCSSREEAEVLIVFASLVWNATRLEDDAECDEVLDSFLRGAPAGLREVADQMMDVAYSWPFDRRFVAKASVLDDPPGGWEIVAATVDMR